MIKRKSGVLSDLCGLESVVRARVKKLRAYVSADRPYAKGKFDTLGGNQSLRPFVSECGVYVTLAF